MIGNRLSADWRPEIGDDVTIGRDVILSGLHYSYPVKAGEAIRYCGEFDYGYGAVALLSTKCQSHCITIKFDNIVRPKAELQCEIDMLNAYIESEGLEEAGDWIVELAAKYTLHRLEASS